MLLDAMTQPRKRKTSNPPKPDDVRMTFDVRRSLRQRIKLIAIHRNTTVRDLVVDVLQTWADAESKRLHLS
jgi:hypothetical protein